MFIPPSVKETEKWDLLLGGQSPCLTTGRLCRLGTMCLQAYRHTPNLRAMDRELGAGGVGVQVCALLFLDTLSPSLDSPDPKCLGPT